jgi:hypothetical protein
MPPSTTSEAAASVVLVFMGWLLLAEGMEPSSGAVMIEL